MRTALMKLGVALSMGFALLPVSALTIETNANYEVEHTIIGTQTDSDGPNTASSGSVGSYVSYGGFGLEATSSEEGGSFVEEEEYGSFGDANAFAADSGRLATGAYLFAEDDVSSMDFHATTSWSNTFTNTTGGNANFDFDFNFSGGRLDIDGNGGMAMFSLDILLNGSSIWSRTASLSGNASVGTDVFDDGGLAHSLGGTGNFVVAHFSAFSDSLDLGDFASGDSFELTYVIESWAKTDENFSYVSANVGDPFSGGFSGAVSTSSSAPVPEPTTMALLGMGIAGLGARRLRKKN